MTSTNTINWIDWHGGDCPVPPLTIVFIRYQSGMESTDSARARAFRWDHMRSGGDIVAYRLDDAKDDA